MNKETISLFGDAAVAIIVAFDSTLQHGIIKGSITTYAEGVELTIIKGGGNKFFFKDYPYDAHLHSFQMDGIKLLRLAKKKHKEEVQKWKNFETYRLYSRGEYDLLRYNKENLLNPHFIALTQPLVKN